MVNKRETRHGGGAHGEAVGGAAVSAFSADGAPTGNTGAKLTKLGVTNADVGIDWLRLVGPRALMDRTHELVAIDHGSRERRRGRNFFPEAFRYESGLELWYDDDKVDTGLCVDLSGDVIKAAGQDSVYGLLAELVSDGFEVTRIDVRADWINHGFDLCSLVQAACESGSLVGARIYKPHHEYDTGRRTAKGISIGRRGKEGSGRYVRFYDKALEQGEGTEGDWERYEVEFTGDCAREVGHALCNAGRFRWLMTATEYLVGSIDFRESIEGESHVDRRPRLEWWDLLLEGLEARRATRPGRTPRLDNFIDWFRRSVLPTVVEAAQLTGQDPEEVLWEFVGEFPGVTPGSRPVVHEYVEQYHGSKGAWK